MNFETLPWYGWIFFTFALSSTANQIAGGARWVYKRDETTMFLLPAVMWVLFLYAGTK